MEHIPPQAHGASWRWNDFQRDVFGSRHRCLQALDSTLTVWQDGSVQGRELGSVWVPSNSTLPWVKQAPPWSAGDAVASLHCPDDLIVTSAPSQQHTCNSEKPHPLRLEIHAESSPLCLVGGVSSRLPAALLSCTKCCSVLTQFMLRKSFSPCGIPASHCLTGDLNPQHFLPGWHYPDPFTPSHNTSALIVLIRRFCHEEQFDYCAGYLIWSLHWYFPVFTMRKNILQAFPLFHTNRLNYSVEATGNISRLSQAISYFCYC